MLVTPRGAKAAATIPTSDKSPPPVSARASLTERQADILCEWTQKQVKAHTQS